MKENGKVIVDITKETDGDAILKTETVVDKMGDNAATFTNPTVALDQMTTDKDDLVAKSILAQNGGVEEIRAKNVAREIVNSNYRSDGNYVNSVAKGNKDIALLSGYEIAKTATKPIPEDFELVNASPQTILVYCRQRPKGLIVKMLQYSYDTSLPNGWNSGGVTRKAKKLIKNLTSGERVWVRLAVVTDEDTIVYCDPISIIVT